MSLFQPGFAAGQRPDRRRVGAGTRAADQQLTTCPGSLANTLGGPYVRCGGRLKKAPYIYGRLPGYASCLFSSERRGTGPARAISVPLTEWS